MAGVLVLKMVKLQSYHVDHPAGVLMWFMAVAVWE